MTPQHSVPTNSGFYGLGIAPKIMETIAHLKFIKPTPVQQRTIPVALEHKDVISIAQTGTGKTMAFAIPVVQTLAQNHDLALIMVPTRELALQVDDTIAKIARPFGIASVVLIGGAPIHAQFRALSRQPRILIATPGRLIDLMKQKKVNLNKVSILVLDEADRMLDMGFAPQIEKILKMVPSARQTMLFSATMPGSIVGIARSHMKMPVQVEIAPPGTSAEDVTHELFIIEKDKKRTLLEKLLKQYPGSILLFCRTKMGTKKLARAIRAGGHRSAEIHSDRSLSQRQEAMEGFRSGRYRILVATDIAARGIDVVGIELVINYDLPQDPENYIHRIGRTGRAGRTGHAISLATPDQGPDVRNIEKLLKMNLPVSNHGESTVTQFEKPRSVYSAQKIHGRWKRSSSRFRGKR